MPFKFIRKQISDVVLIEPIVFEDDRGFFLEAIKFSDFKANGITKPFVQVNHSKSKKGVLRGLHYQAAPNEQGKLIQVIRGEIFDVAVDIRKESPTFGKWVSEHLSSDKKKMLYIPAGFAHGFCVISDEAEIIYYCTEEYSKKHDRGIMWNDPAIGINWPIKPSSISEKDQSQPFLKDINVNSY